MVVQHNMQAMNASRMLGITTGSQSKATEKLSSGYRINRAADDAAGLTISEKMRKQIRGLDRASTNAQDGISAVQTAEGALTEVHAMLQRMNELAVQAANGTNSTDDRQAIQDEIDQLVTEIDRVSETTKFNEIYLLKGGEGSKTEIKETASPAYKDTISADKKLEFKTGGTAIYATKDGKSEAVSDTNFENIFEIGTVTTVETQAADKKATAGTEYTITDATTGKTGAVTVTVADQDKLNKAEGMTLTYDATATAWKNADGNAVTLADIGLTVSGFGAGDTITVTAASVTHTNPLYAENGTEELSDKDIIAAVADGNDIYTVAATTKEEEGIKVKDGYEIYTADADETDEFGDQIPTAKASAADIKSNFNIVSDLLLDKDGNAVDDKDLAEYFEEDGVYKGGLYKYNTAATPALTEIGAEQIDDYVDPHRETKEVKTANPLKFNLHVGAESAKDNKIEVEIKAISASGIGIADLKEKGLMTEDDATEAIKTISEAISVVSKQRSALGAIQNRLEHTIANLDNVVENTTAAESRIRDTDMAEVMVEYSKNNILAQAGQSMLAQANQSTQGVLSLLQ